jgi:hypothetical protein
MGVCDNHASGAEPIDQSLGKAGLRRYIGSSHESRTVISPFANQGEPPQHALRIFWRYDTPLAARTRRAKSCASASVNVVR